MKKIVSFSLWGDHPKYCVGAIRNAELVTEIYPGWIARFYCGKSTPEKVLNILESLPNVEVVRMEEEGNWTSMCWRFYPASEQDVDIFVSRDADSRIDLREKAAVDEWLASGKSIHLMRDHPEHGCLIMGGMWGCLGGRINNITELIGDFRKYNGWGVDQDFLNTVIYPSFKFDSFVHDEYFEYESHRKKFPTPRVGDNFVGQRVDEFEVRH